MCKDSSFRDTFLIKRMRTLYHIDIETVRKFKAKGGGVIEEKKIIYFTLGRYLSLIYYILPMLHQIIQ